METFVVPVTSILEFGLYKGVIERKNCFVQYVHIDGQTFRSCHFVKARQFHLKYGELRHGATVSGIIDGEFEVKTLKIRNIRHCGDKYVFMTPQCDAFYVNAKK